MSLPKIVLETEKTTPVYGLPLRIRQGDKGDVLEVLLGKSFTTYPDLSDVDVTLMAERSDQTLVKAAATTKVDNSFTVTLPDAMYAKVGVFRRVYFKIGDDSTSDIKVEVLSGTGSSSASGNYIQDFEDLLNQAMSYVYALNSLAGTYDAVIDNKVVELTKKMTEFVTKAGEDLEAAKKSYAESQTQSESDAKNQRDEFVAEFKTITDNFNKIIADGKKQNTDNQTDYDSAKAKRETDFTAQSDDFEKRYKAQNTDFESRFKSYLATLQTDYDDFKKILTGDVADLNTQLDKVGADTKALQAKADSIADKLQDVDLSQMQTNKTDIAKLRTDVDVNTGKFKNYTTSTDLTNLLKTYVLATQLSDTLASFSKSDDVRSWIATSANQTKEYAAESIKAIVGAAPETLDTIAELASAVGDNKTIIDALNGAITTKADKSELDKFSEKPVELTQAEYDALPTKEDKFYIVSEGA